jgi:hypothetical protein
VQLAAESVTPVAVIFVGVAGTVKTRASTTKGRPIILEVSYSCRAALVTSVVAEFLARTFSVEVFALQAVTAFIPRVLELVPAQADFFFEFLRAGP